MDAPTPASPTRGVQDSQLQRSLQQHASGRTAPQRAGEHLASERSPAPDAMGEAMVQRMIAAQGFPSVALVGSQERPAISDAGVEALVAAMLANDAAGVAGQVSAARAQGLSLEATCDGLLAPAARRLGELWDQDLCDFVQVTLGLWSLHRAFREQADDFHSELDRAARGLQALLVPAPGESHTLGLAMAVEFFRRAGWEVLGTPPASAHELAALARKTWFDVIGLSASSDVRLDWLASCIQAVRDASRNPDVVVVVGGALFIGQPELAQGVGADFAVTRGAEGPADAERLLAQRTGRRATG